jgi:hypothetical protein
VHCRSHDESRVVDVDGGLNWEGASAGLTTCMWQSCTAASMGALNLGSGLGS